MQEYTFGHRHLLGIEGLTPDDINHVLDLADGYVELNRQAEKPDYELGMLLLDNGVSRDMVIDYGEYSIRAKLDDIEALPKPGC